MKQLRNLDPADEMDQKIIRDMGMITLSRHWESVRDYLEKELHRIDVQNRSAPPLLQTKLGAKAELLAELLEKFNQCLENFSQGRVT